MIYHTQESFLTYIGSQDYVRFGPEHFPGSARDILGIEPLFNPIEAAHLLSHIGDFLN